MPPFYSYLLYPALVADYAGVQGQPLGLAEVRRLASATPAFAPSLPFVAPEVGPCTIAFVSHSGFANQIMGMLNAFEVARAAGCGLVLPPVLEHFDLGYEGSEGPDACMKGVDFERTVIDQAADIYKKRHLEFDQLFEVQKDPTIRGRFSALGKSLASLPQLPVSCNSWNSSHPQEFSDKLHKFVEEHSAQKLWAMGSGFRVFHTEAWNGFLGLGTRSLFKGFAKPVLRASDRIVDHLRQHSPTGEYACIHMRSVEAESESDKRVRQNQTHALRSWISSQVADTSRLCSQVHCTERKKSRLRRWLSPGDSEIIKTESPLLVMSQMSGKELHGLISPLCGPDGLWSSCKTLQSMMSEERDSSVFRLGFPEDQQDYELLMLEMATCSRANVIYLPNYVGGGRILINKKVQPVGDAGSDGGLFLSTLTHILDSFSH